MLRDELIEYYNRCVTFGLECRYDIWGYKVENNLVLLTDYYGKRVSELTIPDGIDGICSGAIDKLQYCLKSLNLNDVKRLEVESLFDYSLEEIIAPNLEYIGEAGLKSCSSLTKFVGDKVIKLGVDAFRDCSKLSTVSLKNVLCIDNSAFYECSDLVEIDAPQVEYIGSYAFAGCDNLVDINLNAGTVICDGAFRWCKKLKVNVLE
jgi:hypothetical protein